MGQKLTSIFKSINWKRTMSYFGLFVVCFFVFLYLTFPYDAVRDVIIAKVEGKTAVKLQIGELSPYRVLGIQVNDLLVRKNDNTQAIIVRADSGRVRVHFWPLLRGRLVADVDMYTYGGGVAGQVVIQGDQMAVAANWKGLDLAKSGADQQLKNIGEVQISGTMDGFLELFIDNKQESRNQGKIRAEYHGLTVTNPTILGTKLPSIVFNEPAVMQLSLRNKSLAIDEWSLASEELTFNVSGRFTPRNRLERSRLNFNISFKLGEKIEDSLGMYAMALPDPDSKGFYNFTLRGTPQNPRFKKKKVR